MRCLPKKDVHVSRHVLPASKPRECAPALKERRFEITSKVNSLYLQHGYFPPNQSHCCTRHLPLPPHFRTPDFRKPRSVGIPGRELTPTLLSPLKSPRPPQISPCGGLPRPRAQGLGFAFPCHHAAPSPRTIPFPATPAAHTPTSIFPCPRCVSTALTVCPQRSSSEAHQTRLPLFPTPYYSIPSPSSSESWMAASFRRASLHFL